MLEKLGLDHLQQSDLIGLLVTYAIWFSIIILQLVLIIHRFKSAIKRWEVGVIVGLTVTIIWMPQKLMGAMVVSHLSESFLPEFVAAMIRMVVLGCVIILWYMMTFGTGASYWSDAHQGGYVLLDKKQIQGRGWDGIWTKLLLSVLIGFVLSVITLAAFHLIGISKGNISQQNADVLRETGVLEKIPSIIYIMAMFSYVMFAAITEEIAFRGLLLPWLAKLFGWKDGYAIGFWIGAVIVSIVWAFMHITNSNMPAVKIAQIFIIGLFFCWMAKKWGVESAIFGHLSLNITATLSSLIFNV
ncbi:CPBP family intramembrane metalloprotease [Planctomycetota bacterium]|nr:CPBP family intramembrane metalloprotease [Planctomycetota bacterium]